MAIELVPDTESKVKIELDASTLAKLLETKALAVSEFRCLDCDSKQCVWRLCLSSCAKCVHFESERGQCCPSENSEIKVIREVNELPVVRS